MHKDLNDRTRSDVEQLAAGIARYVDSMGQSLGLAREAIIFAFDRKAEEIDAE